MNTLISNKIDLTTTYLNPVGSKGILNPLRHGSKGFSLIEVVIAIVVVALALLSITGLLGVLMSGTKGVLDRHETLGVCQSLNSYLQSQGFSQVYGWVQGNTIPPLYAYVLPVDNTGNFNSTGTPQMEIVNAAGGVLPNVANRIGRLFYISLKLSSNFPIHTGVNKVATYSPTTLPSTIYPANLLNTDTTFFADSKLGLSVRIYAVPAYNASYSATFLETTSHNYPILLYDTSINR